MPTELKTLQMQISKCFNINQNHCACDTYGSLRRQPQPPPKKKNKKDSVTLIFNPYLGKQITIKITGWKSI